MMEEKTKFEDDTDISSSENEDEKDNFSQQIEMFSRMLEIQK